MRTMFVKINLKDEATEKDQRDLLNSIESSNKKLIYTVERLMIKRCNKPLYLIDGV